MTLYEVDEAANRIREEVDPEARIIFGSTFDEKMNGHMRVSVVATGIEAEAVKEKLMKLEEKDSANTQTAETVTSNENAGQVEAVQEKVVVNARVEGGQERTLGVISNEKPKKKRSLFERLTGIRTFSSKRNEEISAQQVTRVSEQQEEDLEIPAFLRRNS